MQKLLKHRWIFLIIWLIIAVSFTLNQPNLKQILNKKGEVTISQSSPSMKALKILNKMSSAKGCTILFVFNSKYKMSNSQLNDIKKGIEKLRTDKKKLIINSLIDPFSTPEAKSQLISKDGTTLLAQVVYENGDRDRLTALNAFENELKSIKSVSHYITGEEAINNDYTKLAFEGVDKSSVITILFILIVLILMFRSIVTPLVSLLAVGISYICSMGIIGILIKLFNFPITNFTQMFVILVLFGIGTDYNILLFNRFKEELGKGLSIDDAIITTYKTAGKTILFSCLTVFFAFASLSFVKFSIYRSANAVAIGIASLLIELMTFTPLLMRFLAHKLFWPSHNSAVHKESKVWEKVTSVSIKHPIVSLAVVFAIIVPVIYFGNMNLSFDNLKDLPNDTPSVKGFDIVAAKFGRGMAMPTTVAIESNKAMDNNDALSVIDNLTIKLKKLKGVEKVSGPTQPKGSEISQLYTNNQTKSVTDGLSSANAGIGKIHSGLNQIKSSLNTPDFSKVKDLSLGTESLKNGLGAITNGLGKIDTGIKSGAAGASKLANGINQLKTGIAKINNGAQTISNNMKLIQNGYSKLGDGYKQIPDNLDKLGQLAASMNTTIDKIAVKLPNDSDVITLKTQIFELSMTVNQLSSGMKKANKSYAELSSALLKINNGVQAIADNTSQNSQLLKGITELEAGANALSKGLRQGSAGQETVILNMNKIKSGAEKIKLGQDRLYEGLSSLGSGMGKLKDGISKSSDGLGSISSGLNKANSFLNQLTDNTKNFYIPVEAFKSKNINMMLNAFMSKDRKIAKLTINLNSDPYSPEAMKLIGNIDSIVKNQLKGSSLADAKYGISGPTAITNDLSNIATDDIVFTRIIVLICIFVLLIFVIRSFWIPVYIIASLILAYYTSMSITGFLTLKLFHGVGGLSWNVPFFAFVMIASLGVDYSIFLMTRFKEYADLTPNEAMVMAAKNVGGVVISAAIILSGTFATLYPSNLHVLMELAICVVIGLMMLSLMLLPVFMPSLIAISEKIKSKNKSDK